jgi:hypothetical protein
MAQQRHFWIVLLTSLFSTSLSFQRKDFDEFKKMSLRRSFPVALVFSPKQLDSSLFVLLWAIINFCRIFGWTQILTNHSVVVTVAAPQ